MRCGWNCISGIAKCNILLEKIGGGRSDFFEDERTYYILHGEARALGLFPF